MSPVANLALWRYDVKPVDSGAFRAYVGIDWADTKHDICLQAVGDAQREFDCIPHQVSRIDEWAKSLHQRFGGPIAIALELAKGQQYTNIDEQAESFITHLSSLSNKDCWTKPLAR
jgi:hypothetical protein